MARDLCEREPNLGDIKKKFITKIYLIFYFTLIRHLLKTNVALSKLVTYIKKIVSNVKLFLLCANQSNLFNLNYNILVDGYTRKEVNAHVMFMQFNFKNSLF